MITFRQALDAMGIPYVDDGSPSLDYQLVIYDASIMDGSVLEIRSMLNDHEEGRVIVSNLTEIP